MRAATIENPPPESRNERPPAKPLNALEVEIIDLFVQFSHILGHPCKIYNILNVGAPVLYIGPCVSHISEIAEKAPHELVCLAAQHGEVDKVVKHIQQLSPGVSCAARQPSAAVRSLFSREVVLPKLVAALETG